VHLEGRARHLQQDSYFTIKKMYLESNSSGNSANKTATTGLSSTALIKKLPVSAIHTLAATNYALIISLPLALNPLATFRPPEPPLVFLLQEVKSVDDSKPVEVKSTSADNSHEGRGLSNERNVLPIAKADVDMGDIDLLKTSKPAEVPELVPTAPASSVDGEPVNKKEDAFFQTQKVDQDQLIKILQSEAAYLQEELATAREAKDVRGVSSDTCCLTETIG
jgi:hypothetical protein